MHPAVVLGGVDVVVHRPDLRVLAEARVVVRGPGLEHRAQGGGVDVRLEQSLADQPAGLVGGLPGRVLHRHRGEHVGDALVQRAGLSVVGERRRVLHHAVAELVREHVGRLGEAFEDLAVSVAEDQLLAVPERVVVVLAVVHGDRHRAPGAVDGEAPELLLVQVPDLLRPVVRLVDGLVVADGVALGPDHRAGQRLLVVGRVDHPAIGVLGGGGRGCATARRTPARAARGNRRRSGGCERSGARRRRRTDDPRWRGGAAGRAARTCRGPAAAVGWGSENGFMSPECTRPPTATTAPGSEADDRGRRRYPYGSRKKVRKTAGWVDRDGRPGRGCRSGTFSPSSAGSSIGIAIPQGQG